MGKTNLDYAEDIVKYFNGIKIGSILLVDKDLIDFEDLNDIDIAITEDFLDSIDSYLKDNNFIINHSLKAIKIYDQYKSTIYYNRGTDLTIHICLIKSNFKQWSIEELIMNKLQRGNMKDFNQCIKAIEKLKENKLLDLKSKSNKEQL